LRYEEKYPQQLSGGMQQRTAIPAPSSTIQTDPDGRTVRRAGCADPRADDLEMLRIWRESGKTIIFVPTASRKRVPRLALRV